MLSMEDRVRAAKVKLVVIAIILLYLLLHKLYGQQSQSQQLSVVVTPHSVALSWQPVAGNIVYNMYRGPTSGGPYTKIASGLVVLVYTDTAVLSGKTYYYVVTAQDNQGQESGYSNEVQAVIP